jgi:hypothetical protein
MDRLTFIRSSLRWWLAALLLVAAFSAQPTPRTFACSCLAPGTPQEELAKFDVVFLGSVNRVTPQNDGNVQVDVQVQTIWKGQLGSNTAIFTANNSAACGVEFTAGTAYVVYASQSEGQLFSSLCSRTANATDATADIQALGPGTQPQPSANPPQIQGNNDALMPWLAIGGAAISALAIGFIIVRRAKRVAAAQ